VCVRTFAPTCARERERLPTSVKQSTLRSYRSTKGRRRPPARRICSKTLGNTTSIQAHVEEKQTQTHGKLASLHVSLSCMVSSYVLLAAIASVRRQETTRWYGKTEQGKLSYSKQKQDQAKHFESRNDGSHSLPRRHGRRASCRLIPLCPTPGAQRTSRPSTSAASASSFAWRARLRRPMKSRPHPYNRRRASSTLRSTFDGRPARWA